MEALKISLRDAEHKAMEVSPQRPPTLLYLSDSRPTFESRSRKSSRRRWHSETAISSRQMRTLRRHAPASPSR